MAAIFLTFSNAFFSMKIYEFRLNLHWNLFPKVRLTIFHHWFGWWLGTDQATSHYLNQWRLDYRRIYASLGFNGLKMNCLDQWFVVILSHEWTKPTVNIQNIPMILRIIQPLYLGFKQMMDAEHSYISQPISWPNFRLRFVIHCRPGLSQYGNDTRDLMYQISEWLIICLTKVKTRDILKLPH